jgi:hypothetical protein
VWCFGIKLLEMKMSIKAQPQVELQRLGANKESLEMKDLFSPNKSLL